MTDPAPQPLTPTGVLQMSKQGLVAWDLTRARELAFRDYHPHVQCWKPEYSTTTTFTIKSAEELSGNRLLLHGYDTNNIPAIRLIAFLAPASIKELLDG